MTGEIFPSPQGAERRVAVIDDDHYGRSSLASLLRAYGVEVEAFDGGRAFLRQDSSDFGCVISDIQMPEMNGLQLAKRLKDRWPTLPIILMTAFPEEVGRREAERIGVIHYIDKPFDPDDLLDRLWAIIGAGPGG